MLGDNRPASIFRVDAAVFEFAEHLAAGVAGLDTLDGVELHHGVASQDKTVGGFGGAGRFQLFHGITIAQDSLPVSGSVPCPSAAKRRYLSDAIKILFHISCDTTLTTSAKNEPQARQTGSGKLSVVFSHLFSGFLIRFDKNSLPADSALAKICDSGCRSDKNSFLENRI